MNSHDRLLGRLVQHAKDSDRRLDRIETKSDRRLDRIEKKLDSVLKLYWKISGAIALVLVAIEVVKK